MLPAAGMYPGLFPNASHMKFSKLILAGILTLLSCSIREEREHCPCRLDMDLTAFSPYGRKALVALWDGLDASQEEVPVRDTLHRHVAKGIVGTSVWSGQREGQLSGSRLIVPAGSQPDSLQAFRAEVDCRGETAWVTAVPHKQYARVTLRVDIGPDTHYPYQFYVESDCCGIDLADLAPVPGELVFPVRQVADNLFRFDLLRHHPDTEVRIAIYDEKERADYLPLGQWMRKAGYDWEAEDLADILFDIDYVHQRLRIIIGNWEEGETVCLTL